MSIRCTFTVPGVIASARSPCSSTLRTGDAMSFSRGVKRGAERRSTPTARSDRELSIHTSPWPDGAQALPHVGYIHGLLRMPRAPNTTPGKQSISASSLTHRTGWQRGQSAFRVGNKLKDLLQPGALWSISRTSGCCSRAASMPPIGSPSRADILELSILRENSRQAFEHDRLCFTSEHPDWIHVVSLRNIESTGGGTQDRY